MLESLPTASPRLRLWPAVVLAAIVVFAVTVLPVVAQRTMLHFFGLIGGLILGPMALLVWWLTASRARGWFRWLPVLLFLTPAAAYIAFLYGKAPMNVLAYASPAVAGLWLVWLVGNRVVGRDASPVGVSAVILAGWAAFGLIRIDQTDSEVVPELRWAWNPTEEERFLAERATRTETASQTATTVTVLPGDVPAFRGANRDGRISGVKPASDDWSADPPKLIWKHRIGPGWGTFSIADGRLFTQEQRGPNECVVCYDAATGVELWEAAEPARFYEGIAGAGPRGTPTIQDGKAYALGATGLLQCLDAATGKQLWKTDITVGTGGVVPQWGYAGSPLIVNDKVIVYAGGPGGNGTAAFSGYDGKLAWAAGDASHGYSSAQRADFGGVPQVLMLSDVGLESFAPADGKRLWYFDWTFKGGNRATQPAVIDGSSVLIGTGVGGDQGAKRLSVTRTAAGDFDVTVAWTTKRLRPYFNDGVIHKGHYYGFDDKSLVCVDLTDGKVKWNAGTLYGHGQVLVFPDADRLVVQGDRGQVALVAADPAGYADLGKFPAVKGKTWNHPIAAHGKLYVRNGEEAACYDMGK